MVTLTSHDSRSLEHSVSFTLNFSFSSSTLRLTVTVSIFSRSTILPNFCIIIVSHVSCISEIRDANTLRSFMSWICFRLASLEINKVVKYKVTNAKNENKNHFLDTTTLKSNLTQMPTLKIPRFFAHVVYCFTRHTNSGFPLFRTDKIP